MIIKKLVAAVLTCTLITASSQISVSIIKAENETEISVWDGSTDTFWYNEKSTEFDITTAEEFAGLAKLVNSGNSFKGKTVVLKSDLDLDNLSWTPIGDINQFIFEGTFDGENHTINKLNINGFAHSGLFGSIGENAIVSNIIIGEKSCIRGNAIAGGIVAYALETSLIEHCINYSKIDVDSNGNNAISGGIVGKGGVVRKCGNYGKITAKVINSIQPTAYSGGISGMESDIDSCFNKADVFASSESTATASYERVSSSTSGGISASTSIINNCYNHGNISASTSKYAQTGGILGSGESKKISNCYNIGIASSGIIEGNSSYDGNSYAKFVENSYYLNSCASRGIGNVDNDTVVNPNEKTMKSENFAKTLGKAYAYVEGEYPKLSWEVGIIINIGDVNDDGEINVSDAVMLQKFLLGNGNLINWQNADLCEDECIDIFDMILLRKLLIDKQNYKT